MGDIRSFKFCYGENITINFDRNRTIEDLLNQFLDETNSIRTLDPSKIYFMYNSHIINQPIKLSKAIKDIFKGATREFKITVTDTEGVIGGKAL